jgi:hypothetical protein
MDNVCSTTFFNPVDLQAYEFWQGRMCCTIVPGGSHKSEKLDNEMQARTLTRSSKVHWPGEEIEIQG